MNEPMSLAETPDAQLLALFASITEHLCEVAEIIRAKIAAAPDWPEDFAAQHTAFTAGMLRRLASVGVKIAPQLYLAASAGAAALRHLPLAVQEWHASHPVEVLTADNTPLRVDIHDLLPAQVRQVIARDHIRTLSEQRAWLENERSDRAQAALPPPPAESYTIHRGRLVVAGVEFTRKQLLAILTRME